VESFYLALQQLMPGAAPALGAAVDCEAAVVVEQQQQQEQQGGLHVVDFGCGTGNLLLPLAALFPRCSFTGVDMKPAALQLLQERAAQGGLTNVKVWSTKQVFGVVATALLAPLV
jgi:methylase of polypeptide subunit release factors